MLSPGRKGQNRCYPGSEALVLQFLPPCQALAVFHPGDSLHLVVNCLVIVFNYLPQFPYYSCQEIFLPSYYPVSILLDQAQDC